MKVLLGWGLFLWEQAKDLCLCLFRWHHLSSITYISSPAVLSQRQSSYFTDPTLSQWLAYNFTEPACLSVWGVSSLSILTSESLLLCHSSSFTWNWPYLIYFFSWNLNCGGIISHAVPLMHQKRKIKLAAMSQPVVVSTRVVWSKWCIQVWEKSFCLTF